MNLVKSLTFLAFLVFVNILNGSCTIYEVKDYKTHPCIRPCNNQTVKMICEYDWVIEWYSVLSKACLDCPFNRTNCLRKDCISANGHLRAIMVVNRMLPGPAIEVCNGDTIKITLFNSLHQSEGTSIHWHGLTQRKSPYMDGVSMVTQCPIISHSYFQYQFLGDNVGTHFWHAHSGMQRADGVFGPIIVHEYEDVNRARDKYDFDLSEHVIIVNDWINETSISKFAGHHHNDGDNKPSSILINGRGVLRRYSDSAGNVYETPRAMFNVKSGFRYRFRVINAGILYCPIEISIDNHNMTIIASDGNLLEPREVQSFIIYAGERYDFILNAAQTPGQYWIRAKGYADCNVFKAFETAILAYENSTNVFLNTLTYENASRTGLQLNPWNKQINNSNRDMYIKIDEMRSIELDNQTAEFLKKINTTNVKKYYLSMEFNKINNPEFQDERLYSLGMFPFFNRTPLYTPQINNISMMMPAMPVIYNWDKIPKNMTCNSLNRDHICPDRNSYCSCVHLYEFDLGDVVEFVVIDEGFTFQSNHPMHLHGMSFAVLAVGKLNSSISTDTIKQMDNNQTLARNLDHPPIKDTVTIPVGGYTIVRFVADNPGTWMFHCHLDFHSEVGMALLIKIGQTNDLPSEPNGWPQCGSYFYKDASLIVNKPTSRAVSSSLSSSGFYFILFSVIFCLFYGFNYN